MQNTKDDIEVLHSKVHHNCCNGEDRYCNSMIQFAKEKRGDLVDNLKSEIDMTKIWGEPNNKYGELIHSAPRESEYTITFYTGGGDKLPTCTLCGATMHSFSSCSNKNCKQYKGNK